MKKYFFISSLNFLYFIFFIFGIYPFIPEDFEGASVIILLLVSIIIYSRHIRIANTKREGLIVIFIFFIFFISAVFSENYERAFNRIETMLSLFFIPMSFYSLHRIIDLNRFKNFFFKIYFISCTVFCVISFYIYSGYSNIRYPIMDANFFRNAIMNNQFIGDHPTYISIFLSLGIIFGNYLLKLYKKSFFLLFVILISATIILLNLILIMSKGVILAILASFISSMFFQYRKRIWLTIILILTLSTTVFFALAPVDNNRFNELFNKQSYASEENSNNSTTIRLKILRCNIEKAMDAPIFGYGLGDTQSVLDKCYHNNNYSLNFKNLNSHNQYFFVWLSCGFFGLIGFVFWLLIYYLKAIRNKDYIMLSILVFYSVSFLFENILSRQSGVILFAFIVNYLYFSNIKISSVNSEKKTKIFI